MFVQPCIILHRLPVLILHRSPCIILNRLFIRPCIILLRLPVRILRRFGFFKILLLLGKLCWNVGNSKAKAGMSFPYFNKHSYFFQLKIKKTNLKRLVLPNTPFCYDEKKCGVKINIFSNEIKICEKNLQTFIFSIEIKK